MTDSKAPYSALATDEKAPLPPAYSPTSLEASAPELASSPARGGDLHAARRRRRAVLLSFLTLLTGSVLVATGVGMGAMNGLCSGGRGAGAGRGLMMASPAEANADERHHFKREVTTIPSDKAASASHPTFSTHTYKDGNVSSFVYTTRPIVNPGGYTIGTLTGYVHITSAPTSSASASATATAEETYPTSPQSRFKREESTIPADFYKRAASTKVVYETVTAPPTTTSTTTVWVTAPADDRRRAKRAAEDSEVRFNPDAGREEWKTSVNRKGETVLLVKTTRPIINPGGQTIGTLDGVFVKPAATMAVPVPGAGYHTELKRRGEAADDGLVEE